MQPVLQVLRGNSLVIAWHFNGARHIENMPDEGRCEGNITINRSTTFCLEQLHRHASSCWEITGEVRVTHAPVTKVHPTISWRGGTPNRCTIFRVVEQGDISQIKGGHTPVLNLKYAVLSGKTTTRAQLCAIHSLYQKTTWLPNTQ